MENALSALNIRAPERSPTSASALRLASIAISSTTKQGDGTRVRSNWRNAPASPACVCIICVMPICPFITACSERDRSVQLMNLPRQAMRVQHVHEVIRIELLHVPDAGLAPIAFQHLRRADHRRHAGGVGDCLTAHLGKAFLVVADIVDVKGLLARAVLRLTRHDITDAGLALGLL